MRVFLVVAFLASASLASAQRPATQDADRIGLGILTGTMAGFATWAVDTPYGGYWRDSPQPFDWRAWSSAIAVGVVAGLSAAFSAPDTQAAVGAQAVTLGIAGGITWAALFFRALIGLGADPCSEICSKLVVGLPMLLGLAASMIVGPVYRAVTGPPVMGMVAPLTVSF